MAGRAYQPRYLFMWPTARISVMGPEQAAHVLTQVRADSFKTRGKEWSAQEAAAYKTEIERSYNEQAEALYSTARLWDDGIIEPTQTRDVLSLAIASTRNAPWGETQFGVFRT
jgi:3-methylcrotonyl-CoA carboxylase beta subunit